MYKVQELETCTNQLINFILLDKKKSKFVHKYEYYDKYIRPKITRLFGTA